MSQNIAVLIALGLVLNIPNFKGHFYGKVDNHAHVKSWDREKIFEVRANLPKSSIDKVMQKVEQQIGIQIRDYQLDFFGYQKF